MQIIVRNNIKALAALNGVLSSYTSENLVDDSPGVLWVSNCCYDQLSITVSSSTSAFLMGNVRSDFGSYRLMSQTVAVTGFTTASPVVVTTAEPHECKTGETVYFKGVNGMIEVNHREFQVVVVSPTTLQLQDASGTPIDGSGFTAYVSGGTLQRVFNTGELQFREIRNFTDWFQGQIRIHQQSWGSLNYTLKESELQISLTANLDHKGGTITHWESSTGNHEGRFTDGSSPAPLTQDLNVDIGSIVLLEEATASDVRRISRAANGNIRIETLTDPQFSAGDRVVVTGISVNGSPLEINDQCFFIENVTNSSPWTFELSNTATTFVTVTGFSPDDLGSVSKLHQITHIRGNGIGANGVTLSPDPATHPGVSTSATVKEIRYGVSGGILKAGFAIRFPNPNVGMQDGQDSASLLVVLEDGSMHAKNRKKARVIEGDIEFASVEEFHRFKDFADDHDKKSLACLVLDGIDTESRHSGYFKFMSIPPGRYSGQRTRSVSFQLREVL